MLATESELLAVLSRYAQYYPYEMVDSWTETALVFDIHGSQVSRLLPIKSDWHAVELMAFDRVAFLEACEYVFFHQSLTSGEVTDADRYSTPWRKIEFILLSERRARRDGGQIRVHGLRVQRYAWRLWRFAQKKHSQTLSRLCASFFRRSCRSFVARQSLAIAMHQQGHMWNSLSRATRNDPSCPK